MNTDYLVWCDTETTGLHREKCSIIVAADFATWEDGALAMHLESGLLAEVIADAQTPPNVEDSAIEFLISQGIALGQCPLAGAGIGFDRAFLAREMPDLHRHFHYRSFDVTTLRLLATYRGVEVPPKREVHRVLPDIEDAIALARVAWGWVGGAA